MAELFALALTVGAVLFHTLPISPWTIGMIGIGVGCLFTVFIRTFRALLGGCGIVLCFIVGAFLVHDASRDAPRALYGMRTVQGRIVSVETSLSGDTIVIKDEVYKRLTMVRSKENSTLLPGDRVSIQGTVKKVEDFTTDTGRVFPYYWYTKSKKIDSTVEGEIVLITKGTISSTRTAAQVRAWSARTIARIISFPYDGIAAGMLVGYQGSISQEIESLFEKTGVVHVLVLSGYNITLLARVVGVLLRPLPKKIVLSITFLAILALVLVSGAEVAAVRAGIMGSLAFLATGTVRTYDAFRGLLIAYVAFFVYSPLMLFYDPGFHLSFLATFFMILVIPKAEKMFSSTVSNRYKFIREALLLGVLMPLCMTPYLLYFSGVVPLAAIPANIVFAFATPVVMALTGVGLFVSFIAPIAGILGTLTESVLWIVVEVLRILAPLPSYRTVVFSELEMIVLYGGVGVWLFRKEGFGFIERVRNSLQRHSS